MGVELIIAGALAGGSLISGEMARSEQRKATRARNQIRQRQEKRAKLQEVRQQQIAQARLAQASATTGTMDSSGFRGAMGSIGSTSGGNLAFRNQISSLQTNIAERMESASRLSGISQVLGTGAALTAQFGGDIGGSADANQADARLGSTRAGYDMLQG